MLLDFETACHGPVEWDLAALADEALASFPQADRDLIGTMRRMRSACVAAKCWVAPERAPQLHEAAQVHLKLLRGHQLYDLAGNNSVGAYDGSGGTCSFSGTWSPIDHTLPGSVGSKCALMFQGTALTVGNFTRYGVCYPAVQSQVPSKEPFEGGRVFHAAENAMRESLLHTR